MNNLENKKENKKEKKKLEKKKKAGVKRSGSCSGQRQQHNLFWGGSYLLM